jgi:deazaflavin-dependent oxidoreductase (nitroreductase family)
MKRRAFVLLNRGVNAVVRRLGLRRFRGGDLLYLTTTGRRSGRTRTNPLLYLPYGSGWAVVASNGGANWQPGWWLNLKAGTPATARIDGRSVAVTGSEVTGPERAELWRRFNDVVDYDAYQRKVDRQIAVVALQPVE